MTLLILGLALFFGVHLLSAISALKTPVVRKLGANGYKGVHALISILGIVFIVLGYRDKPLISVPEWSAGASAFHMALPLLWLAVVLQPASHMKSNIKRFTRHPMLWGVALWAGVHLWLNGDHASILLFGSFLVYSLFAMAMANVKGAQKQTKKFPLKNDIAVVAAGTVAFGLLMFAHQWFAGVKLI